MTFSTSHVDSEQVCESNKEKEGKNLVTQLVGTFWYSLIRHSGFKSPLSPLSNYPKKKT